MRLIPALLVATMLTTTGCSKVDSLFGGKTEEVRLPGDRISVLAFDTALEADKALAAETMQLPAPLTNVNWPTSGGRLDHGGGNYTLPAEIKSVWSENIGDGLSPEQPLMAAPVAGFGLIFTMDSDARVTATQLEKGQRVWKSDLAADEERGRATGGGLSLSGETLFAATGYGEVVGLNAKDGAELWRKKLNSPLRSAPTAADGRVYVTTIDNQLLALNAQNGDVIWTHQGFAEAAGLLGAASPAVGHGLVVAAYSSGEVFALRADNGRQLWSDNLAPIRRTSGIATIAAIRGLPVITADGSIVLAISNAGRMVAIDVRSGQRLWEQKIGGSNTPWVAGDNVFVLSGQAQLVALSLKDGRIRWVQQLKQYENPEERSGAIVWSGPILAGSQLWVTNSKGRLMAFNPVNGQEYSMIKLDHAATRSPIVIDGSLVALDDDATLSVWR